MDTKWKRSKGVFAFGCFFIGLSIVIILSLSAVSILTDSWIVSEVKAAVISDDIADDPYFQKVMSGYMNQFMIGLYEDQQKDQETAINLSSEQEQEQLSQESVTDTIIVITDHNEGNIMKVTEDSSSIDDSLIRIIEMLEQEGSNLLYYGTNPSGRVFTNWEQPLLDAQGQLQTVTGYNYYMVFDGTTIAVQNQSNEINIWNHGGQYHDIKWSKSQVEQMAQCQGVIAVAEQLTPQIYGGSKLYSIEETRQIKTVYIYAILGIYILGWLLLISSWFLRKEKRRFESEVVQWIHKVWLEIKLPIWFIAVCFLPVILLQQALYGIGYDYDAFFFGMLMIGSGWIVYFLFLELWYHRSTLLQHSFCNSVWTVYKKTEYMKPFQQRMMYRAYSLLIIEAILVVISIVGIPTIILPLIAVPLGCYLIFRYMKEYGCIVEDMGQVCDYVESMRRGQAKIPLQLASESDLYPLAQNINQIQQGVAIAIEEQTRSERMKVDLITNVSHDLKTPLTSIINYVDLLSKEELSSEAKEYVMILDQKSQRLKSLIADVFDLSKATSATLEVNVEEIDFVRLCNQILGDLQQSLEQSVVQLKLQLPSQPVMVYGDGQKLQRVIENLILNALKYSLEGSRVYITVDPQGIFTIKNIANYEMNFDAQMVVGRFVRGDQARSTEGSGLGLAIAQSYTQACGGQFELTIDGDLFKVAVTLPIVEKHPEENSDEMIEASVEET